MQEFSVRERVYSPRLRLPRHTHEYSNVTVVMSGEIEESAEPGRYVGRSCSVVLKPAGIEHENQISDAGARTLTIQLASDSPMEREIRARRWSWFDEPAIVRAAVALCRMQSDMRAFDLLAAVLSCPSNDTTPPSWLIHVKRILEERFDDHLRFEKIAREVDLHPVYLSRAFHRHVGQSMSEYVRALRLREARHLLSTSRRSVAAIAAESGFTDSSHLCRTFSRCLGVTPKAYRDAMSSRTVVQYVQPPDRERT